MAATDNDALLKAMDQLMKEEDRASVIEYAKQLSTKGGDVVGTMRKMSQQGVDTKKEAAMWKKRALLTAAVAVVVCAVMFGLMVASAEFTKESYVTKRSDSDGRRLQGGSGGSTRTGATNVADDGSVVGGTDEVADKAWNPTDATGKGQCENPPCRRLEAGSRVPIILGQTWTMTERRLDDEGRELSTIVELYLPASQVALRGVNGRRLDDGGDARELTGGTIDVDLAGDKCSHGDLDTDKWVLEPNRCGGRRMDDAEYARLLTDAEDSEVWTRTTCECKDNTPCMETVGRTSCSNDENGAKGTVI